MTALDGIPSAASRERMALQRPHSCPEGSARNRGVVAADRAAFRQLRHLTNNALQRILCQVAQHDELRRTSEGRRLCEDVERRILYSAAVADALFGFTCEPGVLSGRLRGLGEAVIGLMADPDQVLRFELSVAGTCPPALEDTVLRVANELLGNAVKHGMRARLFGSVSARLASDERRTVLTITDDGWGWRGDEPQPGEGLRIAGTLADERGGSLRLERRGYATVVTLALPRLAV